MTRNPKGPRASPAVKTGVPILRKDAKTQSVRSASVSRGNLVARASVNQFPPTLGDIDLHLFGECRHERIYEKLGAHVITHEGKRGVAFAVWAPNAAQVSVVGNFNGWDGKENRMRRLSDSGVWEVFIPGLRDRELYKYEIKHGRRKFLKADPYAFMMEVPPDTSSIVFKSTYKFRDRPWITERARRQPWREPLSIYEVHLGSWRRILEDGNRPMTYQEIAPVLADYVVKNNFTHVEFLPLKEHPYGPSWGYQVSAYYAPSARYGTPDDLRFLVDHLHGCGIGVIMDWVPAHFPKDAFALGRFDGTALYEHLDPRKGEHPDWGTFIFNYGRNEVRNFLIANARYWIDEFHVDGLRVDAVASMLYLDYSRKAGEWLPNRTGGRENLDAIEFLKQFTETVHAEAPGCVTIAEESTAWAGVTTPVNEGGLGFTFKWNMGWMHDTLTYFSHDPVHRRFHHDQLTFAMLYEYSERFIMPLSHDETVHLKGSLLSKMPGDEWQKLANLRVMLAYMFTRPGKKLLFMGTELAPWSEWNHDTSLDWHLRDLPNRAAFGQFLARLGTVYKQEPALWRDDASWEGFSWIDVADKENSVIAYVRRAG